ncbi:MAG TPA: Gfo/Idh/MocA family oxidoreductase [Gemmatimonadaceae bacterium]|nr:Gfo/Idh/MocA family oxidoreductase [Gemmatimonadaceae bacterium]
MTLRVGVIGCGRIARGIHLPVLARLTGVRVAAIAEPDEENRRAAAAIARGASVYADYRDLLRAGGIDAAVICVPPHLHGPVAVAAFDAGLHVYVEKPLVPSLVESVPLLDAWRRARTIGMIGFNFRFHPQITSIRQRVRDGAIGTPLGVRGVFSILPNELPDWKRTRSTGGGVLLDLASHHVDLVHYLLGDEVVRVYATSRSLRGEADHAAVQLELASGVMVQLFASLGATDENRLEILGTEGKLVMDRTELLRAEHVPATERGARARRLVRALAALEPQRVLRSPGAEPSFAAALEAFTWSAAGNAFAGPDLVDGVRNLAVIEAAERSLVSRAAETPRWPETIATVSGARAGR